MPEVVNVRFRSKGKAYFFDPAGTAPVVGDSVIVETAKGLEFGECVRESHFVDETAVVPPLRPVVRIATEEDLLAAQNNREKEKTAFDFCQKKIAERGLEMKLVDVEYSFDNSKILFFFTSGGRVDFRELVKDLASVFRTRIELRQIGVRDSAKLVGGLGICGRPFCCSVFLDDFQPVSIKMAKTQSLSLNPAKISGTCGRLMCCLKYEQDAYEHLLKTVPKVETEVDTPEGKGVVKEVNLLRRVVKVKLADDSTTELKSYPTRELGFTIGGVYKEPEPPEEVPEELPENFGSRYSFSRIDAAPALINDKPSALAEPEAAETAEDGKKSRSRNNRRHRSKKPQGGQRSEAEQARPEPQPRQEKAEKSEKAEKQEKQGQNRQHNRHKPRNPQNQQPRQNEQPKAAQPKPEKQEKQGGGQSRPRRNRGSGKPRPEGGARQPEHNKTAPRPQQPMDEKAKARAAAVAEAVAQAKPGANKRHNPRHHRSNKPAGDKEQ